MSQLCLLDKHQPQGKATFSEASVILFTGEGRQTLPPRQTPSQDRTHPKLEADPPGGRFPWKGHGTRQEVTLYTSLVLTSSGGHCCGRYASYWNEFLFFKKLCRTSILFVGPLLTLNWTYGDVCTGFQRLSFEHKRYEPEHVSKVYPLAQCLNHNFKRYCLIICQVELTCPLRDTCLLWMSLHPVPWTWLNFWKI